jgi:AmmeMemoRadiSam system protein B/AmmeMemoRadiSam system protein A
MRAVSKKLGIAGLVFATLVCLAVAPGTSRPGEKQAVRLPAVAGAFYPANAGELTNMVDGFLAAAKVPDVKEPVALVVPHAGYIYSGAVAAHSFALLKGRKISRVVVIAPSHHEAFPFAAVYDGDAYATPLGNIPVDKDFAARLAKGPFIKLSSRGHISSTAQGEHALEVELPFLQRVLGGFSLVPVVMGDQSYETSRALGVALAKLVKGNDTIIIASSDLSHYHPYAQAVSLDSKTLRAIEAWDYLTMWRSFRTGTWEACGGGPIIAAMIAAERLGATQAEVLKYANSGDTTSDRSRVVGYGAVVLARASGRPPGPVEFSLSDSARRELLEVARRSVDAAVKHTAYAPATPSDQTLLQERGVFVTLTKKGELRGCIGYVMPIKPLYQAVAEVAVAAALQDPRFPPVTTKELDQLGYEISVLSPFRRVLDIKQIEVGRDGLLMRRGSNEGILLPQVPVDEHWDRNTFLEQAGVKAGLSPKAWQGEDTDIFTFSALVFGRH